VQQHRDRGELGRDQCDDQRAEQDEYEQPTQTDPPELGTRWSKAR
jgi:hypothetical protein